MFHVFASNKLHVQFRTTMKLAQIMAKKDSMSIAIIGIFFYESFEIL